MDGEHFIYWTCSFRVQDDQCTLMSSCFSFVVVPRSVKFFSKLNYFIFGFFDPTNNFLIIKINNFWGDLSGISAKTASLPTVCLNVYSLILQITVVDASTFISDYSCRNALASRPDLGAGGTVAPVVALLVEQAEIADYVILNKVDILGEDRLPELTAIVQIINPLCEVIPTSHGKVCSATTDVVIRVACL